ncbi:MRP-L47-domain-containing protein [Hypoxylon sp. FL1857]|nr:MRP-L47-domain-containing protein [Hypoxylon sp. FL1857]
MAMATSVRPSIGRIISSASNKHAANPSPFLAVLSIRPATQSCPFSSTPERSNRRPRRDNNRLRGVSSLYRSGPRFRMNIRKEEVPKPADFKPEVEVDPDHGLWEFFYSKEKLLLTPEENTEHGRGWSVEELRHKSWEDLHKLWWVCVKELNRISTARLESERLKLRTGDDEMTDRLLEVRKTMKAIKHALTERYYLWEDARKLAETDPEVDLSNTNNPYKPSGYLEEDIPSVESPEGQQKQEGSEKPAGETIAQDPSAIPPSATGAQQPSARV